MPRLSSVVFVLLGANILELSLCKNVQENSFDVAGLSKNHSKKYELIFAHIIHRHGERNIHKPYPKDPYSNESYWPGGSMALTNVGKKQLFELGKYLRRRYQNLIGSNYSFQKVYIHSTDTDRTLMSAASIAAGMFPPSENEIWNNELNWQPTPIHTRDVLQDYVFGYHSTYCPRYDELYMQFTESTEFKYQIEKNSDFIKFLKENTGHRVPVSLDVFLLFNMLLIEKNRGFVLPDWIHNISQYTNDTLEQIISVHCEAFTHSNEMKKFGAGFLLKEMLDRFKNKSLSLLKPDRSLWIYSAHDITIANFLNALKLYELHIPPFASSLFFELHKHNGSYFVQLFYRKTPTENVPPLNIPNCGVMCPLDKFYELYENIMPKEFEDYETLCNSTIDN